MKESVIAITGGASGIGLATAKILHSKGAALSIADISTEALDRAKQEFEGRDNDIMYSKVDISKRLEVDAWIKNTVDRFGTLTGAANCAGVANSFKPLTEIEDEEWDRTIGINLSGTMYCLRAELRNIVGGGSIVSVSSVSGLEGIANLSAYTASKHGVIGLTRAAAKEVGGRKIRVNAVAPGVIRTPMTEQQMEVAKTEFPPIGQLGRHGEADEVASLLVWLLGPESTFVTGSVYTVDGGWHC